MLDFVIMADYYSITVDVKRCLKMNYEVKIPVSNKDEFQSLFADGSYGNHYIGALERGKTFVHHFNGGVQEHLVCSLILSIISNLCLIYTNRKSSCIFLHMQPLERIIGKFFQCCPTLHLDLFENLRMSKFDFSIFFQGEICK